MRTGLFKVLISFIGLSAASIQDYKTRMIDNRIWIAMISSGVLMTAYETFKYETYIFAAMAILPTLILSGILWFLGLYGGADIKALLSLSLLLPYPPFPTRNPVLVSFPLTVFINANILSLSLPIFNLIHNSSLIIKGKPIFHGFDEPFHRKIIAVLIGRPVKPSKVGTIRFHAIMEKKLNGARKFVFLPKIESYIERKENFENDYVWVTPGIPFIVFLTFGLILSLLYGDLTIALLVRIVNLSLEG